MTRFVFSLLIVLSMVTVVGAADQLKQRLESLLDKNEDSFVSANKAYRNGEYEKARSLYQEILREKPDTAVLYNLGNTYFKSYQESNGGKEGLLGNAILCYEKVLRVDPSDHDAASNLAYARSLVVDKFEESEVSSLGRFLTGIYRAPSTSHLELSLTCLVWFLCFVLLLRRRVKRESLSELLFWCLFLILPVLLSVLVWTSARAYDDETRSEGIILASVVDARSAPQESGTHVFSLHEGTRVRLVRFSQGWVQIGLPNGFAGWIRSEVIGRID